MVRNPCVLLRYINRKFGKFVNVVLNTMNSFLIDCRNSFLFLFWLEACDVSVILPD